MPLLESYIASLDVGTTTIRCQILNSKVEKLGISNSSVKLIYPESGFCEIDPNELWESVIKVIKDAIDDAHLEAKDIKCLSISTQRSTFITWHRDSGEPFHNFITWKDLRAERLCSELNNSLILKSVRMASYLLYLFTINKRYLTGSRLRIVPNHVTGRLLWAINNIESLNRAVAGNNAMFGTVDTWLIYKFSMGRLHCTDITNASATGFFDPFVMEWGSWAKQFLNIPGNILPKVVPNDFNFGDIDKEIFGAPIPIKCVMADQSSSMFASCCFKENDLKVTLGTGAFLDVNTGNSVHTSVNGLYPLICWKIGQEITYMAEGACNDCGSLINWLLKVGFVNDPAETCHMATEVDNADGVHFIPAFSGLGPPINNVKAASGFLGIKPTTVKEHIVRSVLESITYRIALCFKLLKRERSNEYKTITYMDINVKECFMIPVFSVDGGVSKNDFICQKLADLTGLKVQRRISVELSTLGTAFVAGLSCGIWNNKEELKNYNKIDAEFTPGGGLDQELDDWLGAVERFKSWYNK